MDSDFFITARNSFIAKNFQEISRVYIKNGIACFFSSKVILGELGLKILERYITNLSLFFIASGPTPVVYDAR